MSFSNSLLESFNQSQVIDTQPLIVNPQTLVHEVILLMNQHQTSCALVAQQQHLIGIFTERDVVKLTAAHTLQLDVPIQAIMTPDVITLQISAQANIFSVLNLLHTHQIRHLPVVDESNQILGLITPSQIRHILKPTDLLKFKQVGQLMTTEVLHAPPTVSLIQIAQQMAAHKVSCIVITETNSAQQLIPVGIITERDIVHLQISGINFSATTAGKVMTQRLQTIEPTDSLWAANEQMKQHRIRRLVVVNAKGNLAGLLTQKTILAALDPIEMSALIATLQQELENRTTQLSEINEQLQQEMSDRAQLEEQLILQNIQLQQAVRAAHVADIAKRNFLTSLNHELRTPLHAILGFSTLMQQADPLSPKQQTYLTQILCSGEGLLKLIDNLLEIAKIEPVLDDLSLQSQESENLMMMDKTTINSANACSKSNKNILNLSHEALANLPSDWLVSLHQAIIEGDLDWALSIIAQIQAQNEPLGNALAVLATQLEFEELLSLTALEAEN